MNVHKVIETTFEVNLTEEEATALRTALRYCEDASDYFTPMAREFFTQLKDELL